MEPTRARMMQWLFWLTLVTLVVFFLQMVRPILLPFVVGMGVAYLFDPVADRLERLGLSRALAATFITLTFFIVLALILIWVGPLVYRQLSALLESLPNILASLRDLIEHQLAQLLHRLEVLNGGDAIPPEQLTAKAVTAASALLNRLMVSGAALLNLLSLLFITPIVCFYLLRDWDKIVEALDRLLPRAHAPVIREQFRIIDDTLAGYLRGQVTVMAILAIYYAGLLGFIGVNFSLVIALITALSIIIPYVGTLVSFSLALGVTYFGFGLEWQFWSVAGVYVLGQIMEQQFLTPTIVGKNVGLHPLWMLFGMLAGAVTMGFVGVLLAVPITAVIGVLVRFFVGRYLASPLYGA
ncbi:MAG: AI-2E family transporter [Alphaproteobacteria bacterium]